VDSRWPPGSPRTGGGADIRTFSCTSHVLALLYGQISKASSLNEICDAARLHESELNRIRNATAPKRNTFSNANRTRDPDIAERLYWMTFITNNFDWSPRTVAERYRARWAIEIFFKELEQTLQLSDFVGYNEKAVKWQVWIGLLAHLLLRFLKHVSTWGLSFSRLAGTVRSAVWMKIDLLETLRIYGTAGGPKRPVIVEKQLYFQGFERFSNVPVG